MVEEPIERAIGETILEFIMSVGSIKHGTEQSDS
jgi:hypothetical protein